MSDLVTRLTRIIESSLTICQDWLTEDSQGGLRLLDPVEGRTVNSHYGDSHFAAALILLGNMRNDVGLTDQGIRLIETVIRDWDLTIKFRDFHNDFNNFALCLIDECLEETSGELSQSIRTKVLSTRDSNHDTINWLPLRAYVNRCRYEWTRNRRYLKSAERSLRKVRNAINADGGIEDRLPAGLSYNLQYNVTSLAALQIFSRRWPLSGIDLSKCQRFLLDKVLPDGDINYVGRGTNQIFGWGAWLYLLASTEQRQALQQALCFLSSNYTQAGKNQNILLNPFFGYERLFWWDYHFCSVYHAHFLLWSVLALKYFGTVQTGEGSSVGTTTGLLFKQGSFGGAVIFEGRKTYLTERGPSLCALWLDSHVTLFKGGLGPWQGSFGKKHSFADIVFQNHFGLISQKANPQIAEYGFFRKLIRHPAEPREAIIAPVFADIEVDVRNDTLVLIFNTASHTGYLNTPILEKYSDDIELDMSVDGQKLEALLVGKSKSPYGWNNLRRSQTAQGACWQVVIRKKSTRHKK